MLTPRLATWGRALAAGLVVASTVLIPIPSKADPAAGPGAVSRLVAGALPAGVVPDGTCRALVTATGGGGASSPTAAGLGGLGGAGAVISATFVVVPGQSYGGSVGGGGTVPNGGTGNGAVGVGGNGGTIVNNHRGGGGGGRTSVVLGGLTVVIAGGGGGGGAAHQAPPNGRGGGGGFAGIAPGVAAAGTNGTVGVDGASTANGGQGGQVGAGGAGGVNSGSAARNGFVGGGIGVGTGGNGGVDPNYDSGGGGGGGYTGGGGGASTVNQTVTGAGGGGGSSWVVATSPVVALTAPTSVTGAAGPASPVGAGPGATGSITIDWLPCLYDLQLLKSVAPSPVNPGATATWTVSVANLGPSAMTKGDTIDLADTLPGPATVVASISTSGGVNANLTRGAVTCTGVSVGSAMPAATNCSRAYAGAPGTPDSPSGGTRGLDSGETLTITYTQAIPGATACGTTYLNTATVKDRPNQTAGADITGVTVTDNVNATLTVGCSADLSITKSDGVASVVAGTSTTYTITVTNNGPSSVPAGVIVSDTIPAGTNGSELEANCAIAAGVFTCTTPAVIASGASVSYQLTLAVSSGYAPATLANTAAITSSPVADPTPGNNSATDTDNISRSADLAIAKADSADPVNPGQAFTYTLTVTNNGPSDASNLTVSDTVPAQFTVTGVSSGAGSCGNVGNVVTCTRPALANAGSWAITVNVTANAATPAGTYTNTATASATEADPVPANNSGSQNTTVNAGADLSITKSDGVASVIAGTSTTYTITVTNNGPSAEPAGVVVSDTIPANTVGSELEANCAIAAGVFTCTTTAALASGASVSYQLTLAVSSSFPGASLVNTAAITSSPIVDPTPGNNTATDTDSVTGSADLAITKSDGVASVIAGTSTTYTITVTNNGPSSVPAGVVVSDTIPANTVGSEVEANCAIAAGVFTCTTTAAIASGGSVSYQLTLAVAPGFPGATLSNTASITASPVPDPVPANNSATDTDSVTGSADLAITKTDGVASVVAGTSTTYTITLTNNGPSTVAAGVVVSDTIPANTVGSESEPNCVLVAGVFTCTTTAALAPAASVAYQLTLAVSPSFPGASLSNMAVITSSPLPDPVPGNNSATDTDAVSSSADLAITKTDGVASVVAGTSTTYTITLTNNGPSTVAAGVVVSDTIPANTVGSESEPNCAIAAGVFTCTTTATLAPGASVAYQLTLAVSPSFPGVSLSNTAAITSSPLADAVPGNNSATDTDAVTNSADLSITKTDGVASVIAGTFTTYTITITNNGPSTVPAGVVVSDTVPAGTLGSELEPNCVLVADVLTCTTTAALAPPASVSYQLTLAIPANYPPATVVNTATITFSPTPDLTPANDTATDTDTVTASADLSITKSDSADPVDPGTSFFYTITVTNNGPSDASGLIVSDAVPAGFTITSVTSALGVCGNIGNLATCTLASLALGATWTITINVDVDAGTGGGLYTDTATVVSTSADPVPGNNSDSEGTVVTPAGDLTITKTDGVASVIPGTSTTYTITLTNNGPSNVPAGAVVSDTIPANTVGSELEPNCVIAVGVFTCTTTAVLGPGASVSYQLTLAVSAAFPGVSLVNTATISSSPIPDPFPGNNSATDTDSITGSADLSITKSDAPDPVFAGQNVTYTLTVSNAGPSDATAVVATDTLPGSVLFVSAVPTQGSCSQAAGVVTCPLGTIAAGATATITIVVTTTIDGTITNTTSVTSSTADPVPGNNSDSEDTTVNALADLSITKSDGVASVIAGTSTTYTITITNNGPSTVPAGVIISDTIPAGTNGSELEPDCAIAAGVLTCTTTAALAPAASVSYQLTLAIPANYAGPTVVNTATISFSPTPDPIPANNSATDTDTVTASADLSITKSDGVASVTPGTSTTYTITLTNNGPSTEPAGVVVSDTIPANTVGSELEADCVIAAGTFTCTTTAALSPAASVSYQLTIAVSPSFPGAFLVNTASITSSPIPDPTPANDTSTDTDAIAGSADLAITKTDGVASITAGTSTTYTITLTNNGPSAEPAGVVVSDTIPANTVGSELEADCAIAAGVFTCTTTAALAPAASVSYQLTLAVSPAFPGLSLSNTAAITSAPLADSTPANDTATDTDAVAGSADLAITKTDGVASVTAGTSTTYTITITNNGPSTMPAGVVVSDTIPAGTNPSESEPDCAIAAGVFTCTAAAALAPAASVSYLLTLAIPANYAPATVVNTATISFSPTSDPTPANNSATDTDTVTASADLSLVKVDAVDPVIAGANVTYTLTVTNIGPSDATGVAVVDTLPGSVVFVSAVPSRGSCLQAAGVVACAIGAVPLSGVVTITIVVTTTLPGVISNTATVSATSTDPVPANDSDTETTTVLPPSADLSLAKTDGVATVNPGTSTTYTITLTNNGPSTEPAGVVLGDPIPVGTIGSEAEANCAIVVNVFVCTTTAALVSGASVSYQLTLAIPAGYALPALSNSVAITSTPIADPNPANDSATDVDALTTAADLSIVKTDAPDPVTVGATLTYTLTVTNNGPADATGVTITDTLPAGVTFGTATPTQGSCAQAAGVVTCPLGIVVVSATATVTITVTPTVAGSISNTATVTAVTLDPIPANNSATATTVVGALADLSITKTDGIVTIKPGMSATYSIPLTNNGPSDVPAGIVVTDQVPASTTGSESEANCTLVGTMFICTTTAVLASGSSVTYQLTVAVGAAYIMPTLVNTATITTSPVPDPNLGNNTVTDTDTVTPIAVDLSVVKTDSADPVQPGDTFTYTITVTNAGPDDATGVVVTDPVPSELTVTAVASSGTGTCIAASNLVTCSIDPLAVGVVWTITVTVDVPLDAASGTVTNTATVAGAGDTDPSNDSASETTTIGTVVGSADLAVTKTVDDASPKEGDTITYTVHVANNGPDDATGVQITDLLPAGLTYVSDSPTQGSYDPATGLWDVGSLAVGESAAMKIRASVDAGTAGTTITNGASVSGEDQSDPRPNDDSDTAPADVAPAGGTAFTGLPSGPAPFAWLFAFAILGLLALGFGRVGGRRMWSSAGPGEGAKETPVQPARYLAEPFFFFKE